MELKITGWPAIGLVILVALFAGDKFFSAHTTLDTDGKTAIQQWIAQEYQRYHLARTDISKEKQAQLLLKSNEVVITSFSARGNSDSVAVRIEIEPNEAHPPNLPLTRYFTMKHSMSQGWRYAREITPFSYYMNIL